MPSLLSLSPSLPFYPSLLSLLLFPLFSIPLSSLPPLSIPLSPLFPLSSPPLSLWHTHTEANTQLREIVWVYVIKSVRICPHQLCELHSSDLTDLSVLTHQSTLPVFLSCWILKLGWIWLDWDWWRWRGNKWRQHLCSFNQSWNATVSLLKQRLWACGVHKGRCPTGRKRGLF